MIEYNVDTYIRTGFLAVPVLNAVSIPTSHLNFTFRKVLLKELIDEKGCHNFYLKNADGNFCDKDA